MQMNIVFMYPSGEIRVAMFEEGVEVIRRMWTDSPANFDGVYYKVADVFCEPMLDPQPIFMLGVG